MFCGEISFNCFHVREFTGLDSVPGLRGCSQEAVTEAMRAYKWMLSYYGNENVKRGSSKSSISRTDSLEKEDSDEIDMVNPFSKSTDVSQSLERYL